MPARDLDLLIKAALAAGDIATGFSGASARKWDKPDGAGPVTEADLAVNRMLEDTLRSARSDYGWLSEESEDGPDRLSAERVFIVDPLDGTRSFIEGGSTWAHSLAIAERGRVVAGVIFLPLRDRLFAAAAGDGATLNRAPIHASEQVGLAGATLLAARPAMEPQHWQAATAPDVTRVYRPSLAYRLGLVAQGRFDAMLTLRDSWEWDIAAGDLILREAGALSTDRHGAVLSFNNPHPQVAGVIAAAPGVHGDLRAALKHRAPA